MYNEFINGTGCKENDHNYKVYKDLEILYMNSDLTKEEIYEYGKKLVDNSKSKAEIEFEEGIKAEIELEKSFRDDNKRIMVDFKESADFWKSMNDMEMYRMNYDLYKYHRDLAKASRTKIANLRSLLH